MKLDEAIGIDTYIVVMKDNIAEVFKICSNDVRLKNTSEQLQNVSEVFNL